MGQTPGHLPSAISLQARKGRSPLGSTKEEQILFATSARDWHREADSDLKEVHNIHQAWASKPDGPTATLVFKAVDHIRRASLLSKTTG